MLIKQQYLIRCLSVKKDLNISLATKMLKRLNLYGETLMKLNVSFLIKDDELLEKYTEIWKKSLKKYQKEFDINPVF